MKEVNGRRARDLMQTDVRTVGKGTLLIEAAGMMRANKVSSLIIEPEDDKDAFGIITQKDIVEALIGDEIYGGSHVVEDVMSKPAITVDGRLAIGHCLRTMSMFSVRRLPVTDGPKLVGILSYSDIFNELVNVTSEETS